MCCKERSKSLLFRQRSLGKRPGCSLAVGLKRLGQAARAVQRFVHGVEQRRIVQLGTAVNVALRKDVAAHHHCFRLTSEL
jgi:hypothetical protein